ncbi:hypothetical protein PJ985_09110 [Streptomyces sp. ACA25]|uniref:hypothetical protein n=1 Tax=Streptomyces sp. ACA25 TaxID=3022596 RepID=UPI002307B901|nr:hypothetical protein [Streptomyces sp. ACA25]MDB1087723.1 hypothetical protein [Streptomyces sp. ACA25]
MRADSPAEPRALLLNGTVGVGKSSVAEAVGGLLAEAAVPHAVIDLDSLRRAWPAPPGDRFHFGLMLRNLSAVAGNCLAAGAVRLLLAGVVETREQRQRCADAVGVELSVCRLRAGLPVIRERLTRRHAQEPEALRWHLERAGELAGILDRAGVDDFTVDAGTDPVTDVAAAVLQAAGRH